MNRIKNTKLPLHSRYSKEKSLEMVRNRYFHLKEILCAQVPALQNDIAFCELCKEYYNNGYKDWMILSIIANIMLNIMLNKIPIPQNREEMEREVIDASEEITGKVYPTYVFNKEKMDSSFVIFALTTLKAWGFEIRRARLSKDEILNFLSERMAFFEDDIDHQPLFSKNGGEWPEI